jgi:ribosomal protein S18 acetylase RimI-like enzyme
MIRRASDLEPRFREAIVEILIDAFYDTKLSYLSSSKSRLRSAYSGSFIFDFIWVAMLDDEIVGAITLVPFGETSLVLVKKNIIRSLGIVKGNFVCFVRKHLLKLPFQMDSNTGNIEFLATNSKYRGQGIATVLLRHVIENSFFEHYILDVADTNTAAIKLYKKLGFIEFKRKRFLPYSGIGQIVYMKYSRKLHVDVSI